MPVSEIAGRPIVAVNDGVGQAGDGGNFNATYGRDLPGVSYYNHHGWLLSHIP